MSVTSKHAFGSKDNIETAKTNGVIGPQDVLFLDNREIGWIAKDGSTVISTSRTQEAIIVNGVTSLGIADGATISAGTSLDEFVRMVVQKAIPATYTKPSLSIANNGGQASGNVETGTTITPKLKATFTKNDAGNLTSVIIKKGSSEVANGTESPLTYTGEDIVIGDETIIFSASAEYADAPVKTNNLGQESKENWFAAGTINSSNYSITGKRNLFYGTGVGSVPEVTSDIVRGLVNKKLAPSQGTSFNINVAVGQQYIVIAYPANIRDINNITYVEANDSGMASNFTKTTIDVADARGGSNGAMGYKVYTYAMAVPAAAAMTFKVTI